MSGRIILVAHNVVRGDGQGRVNLEIARRAAETGRQVVLLADTVDADLLSVPGIECKPIRPILRRPNLFKVAQFARMADEAVWSLRRLGDTVVANGYTLTQPHDVNLCQFVHAGWFRTPAFETAFSGAGRRWYQALYTRYNIGREQVAYRVARHIVAPSRQTAAELQTLVVPGRSVSVIPNGHDATEFYAEPAADRTSVGLPMGVPLAVFAGDARTNRKGLREVLHAVAAVPNVHLVVIGKSDGSPFPAHARLLGIADRVHFLGFRHDVGRLMRSCDVFIFPSAYEPFGIVVLEALASGLPVITTAQTGAADLLNEACGIVLAPVEGAGGLADALRHYTKWPADPARRAAAVDAARPYTWTHMADAYLALFDAVVGARTHEALGHQS